MELARLEVLSTNVVESRLRELIALDGRIESEGWRQEQFEVDLPDKFRHSRLAVGAGDVAMGFVVASRKGSHVHVHRLVVGAEHQRLGIGRRLVAAVAVSALGDGLATMTLKVSATNGAALRFYERLGFEVLERGADSLQLTANNDELVVGLDPPGRIQNA